MIYILYKYVIFPLCWLFSLMKNQSVLRTKNLEFKRLTNKYEKKHHSISSSTIPWWDDDLTDLLAFASSLWEHWTDLLQAWQPHWTGIVYTALYLHGEERDPAYSGVLCIPTNAPFM